VKQLRLVVLDRSHESPRSDAISFMRLPRAICRSTWSGAA
jgi:hypothetical protein